MTIKILETIKLIHLNLLCLFNDPEVLFIMAAQNAFVTDKLNVTFDGIAELEGQNFDLFYFIHCQPGEFVEYGMNESDKVEALKRALQYEAGVEVEFTRPEIDIVQPGESRRVD